MHELPVGRLRTENFVRQTWFATAESGTAIEELLRPGYWAFVAKQFHPYDKITVASDDNEWLVELLVTAVTNTAARVIELHRYEIAGPEDSEASVSNLKVKWRGPHHGFCIVRRDNGEVVRTGFGTHNAAAAELVMSEGVRV